MVAPKGVLAALAGGVLLLAGCQSTELGTTTKVFSAPPWTGPETLQYELYDRELRGFCTHRTLPDSDGTVILTTDCTDAEGDGNQDNTTATVDAETLEPLTSSRVIVNVDQGTITTREAEYHPPDEVIISLLATAIDDPEDVKQEFESARDLPEATEDNPEPGWYDESSLFWLARGIPREEGFEDRFANVNISTVQIVGVDIEVEGIEQVEVPAGTFMAWNIRVESSITNRFWVDVEAPHRVVRARLEDTTFELASWE